MRHVVYSANRGVSFHKSSFKTKITIALSAIIASLLLAASSLTAFAVDGTSSTPNSDGGVTPYIIDSSNQGGNRTCAEVGTAFFNDPDYYEFSSNRINYGGGATVSSPSFPSGLTVSVTDGKFVSWSGASIGAVIVKGSAAANVYQYDPQRTSDGGLAAPSNASGGSAGLSNITFCWNPETTASTQWCSPGYWRQPHHLDSWDATGHNPEDSFSEEVGHSVTLSKKGKKDNAPEQPELIEVLQHPQWYSGDDFNEVADLLSAAHPNVDFKRGGERIENSCPLN